jgi:hypothetical protein
VVTDDKQQADDQQVRDAQRELRMLDKQQRRHRW